MHHKRRRAQVQTYALNTRINRPLRFLPSNGLPLFSGGDGRRGGGGTFRTIGLSTPRYVSAGRKSRGSSRYCFYFRPAVRGKNRSRCVASPCLKDAGSRSRAAEWGRYVLGQGIASFGFSALLRCSSSAAPGINRSRFPPPFSRMMVAEKPSHSACFLEIWPTTIKRS